MWIIKIVNWRVSNLLRSPFPEENHEHTEAVSGYIDVTSGSQSSQMQWEPISSSTIMTTRFNSKGRLEGHNCPMPRKVLQTTRNKRRRKISTNSSGQQPKWRHQNPHRSYECLSNWEQIIQEENSSWVERLSVGEMNESRELFADF
uniref:Uncharacterized protein n=1 Tax=Trichobilharzia regenti TaxID=157069 RepID=A0AA85KM04_TRIRE|nr:unnamed protein product [Trichobilharzia regenti]